MIEKIEMHIPNYDVLLEGNHGIINGKNISFDENDFRDIIRIIRGWKSRYYNGNSMNKERYYIIIQTDKNRNLVEFIGDFPSNFHLLLKYLGDLYVR